MTVLAGKLLCAALIGLIAVILIGHAMDQEARSQQRVITTRHGRTLDCRVDYYEDGSIYLNDCNYVEVYP